MDFFSILLIVAGLTLFEIVSSIDNAVINAEVLSTMGQRARRWFLTWGIFFAVVMVRGMLPLLIIWAANPSLGIIGSLTATFSNDPHIAETIEQSAPILLVGGGVFLLFLFFHWIFLEDKRYGLVGERFIHRQGVWFFAVVSVLLSVIVWYALQQNPLMAFGAVVGSTVFFITHGFKQNAELQEKNLLTSTKSDLSKLFYLEAIDTSFSIDGVLGAFAFTFSIPLIFLGNGIGVVVLRELTIHNIERIKRYIYLKNGAMYAIGGLGTVMILDSFGAHIPHWVSPSITFVSVGYFFLKSRRALRTGEVDKLLNPK